MAVSFSRQTVTTGTGATSLINNNFIAIQSALEKVLSRDGSTPNAMLTTLDMNSNRIINLPPAASNTEPVTYAQFQAAQGNLLYTGTADASVVTYTTTGTGAEESTLQQFLTLQAKMPEQFGAIGDGVADDTAAVQACIDACLNNGVAGMYCPNVYKITSSLQVTVTDPGSFCIFGAAAYTSRFVYSGSGYCFLVGTSAGSNACDGWRVVFKNLGIYGANATPTGGIKFGGTRYCAVENCIIREFTNASGRCIYLPGVGDIPNYYVRIFGNQFRNAPYGIYMEGGSGIGANSNYIKYNWFGVHSSYAIYNDGGDTNIVEANEFNGSITTAIYLTGDGDNNKILYNQFDGPTTSVQITSGCNNTILFGNTGGTVSDAGTGTLNLDPILQTIYHRAGLVVGGSNMPTNIVPLRVRAPAGLSTYSFQIEDSGGNYLLRVNQQGATEINTTISTHGKATFKNDVSGNSVVAEVNTDTTPTAIGLQLTADSIQSADMAQLRTEAGTVLWRMSPVGAQTFTEQTAPSAPSANQVVIYAQDNGGGKTQLMARFATGAAQQLAIEP